VAAGAATAYLVGKIASPAAIKAAALHSYTTAFLWSSIIFVAGAVVAGLVLRRGNLIELAGSPPQEPETEPEPEPVLVPT